MQPKFNPMKTKNLIVAAICLGSAFIVQQASAAFTLIDNLTTGHSAGTLAGQAVNGTAGGTGGWVGMGAAGGVNIGTAASGGQGAISDTTGTIDGADYVVLPTPIVGGTTATIFFQFDASSSILNNDNMNFTVENVTTATPDSGGSATGASDVTYYNANQTGENQGNRLGFQMRNGGAFTPIYSAASTVFNPAASTLYSAWMVINNPSASAPSWTLYMSGGSLGSTAVEMGLNSGYTTFSGAMRTPSNGTTINDFVFGPGGTFTAPGGGEALLDLYEDGSGSDTVNPVAPAPEPGTLTLLGFSGLLLVQRLRRRNA